VELYVANHAGASYDGSKNCEARHRHA